MAKKGRGKKAEPIVVEAADSTSVERQSKLNENGNDSEKVKTTAPKKGGRPKKDIEKVADTIVVEEKMTKTPAVKGRGGRPKKQEIHENDEMMNGEELEAQKADSESIPKKGKSKKELNGEQATTTQEIVEPIKKSRGKKNTDTVVEPIPLARKDKSTEPEIMDKKKKADSVPPAKRGGRKRAAETPSTENGEIDEVETEIIETKKQKKEKETKTKEQSTEKDIKSTTTKAGRGRKKKEIVESEEILEPVSSIVEKTPKSGRGKKRSKTGDEDPIESVEDIDAQEKIIEPVAKKEKKAKAVKETAKNITVRKPKTVAEKKPKQNATETLYNPDDFEIDNAYTIKISSWNVAGLRSWVNKGGLKYIQYEKPDIFCLQETKCSEDMIPEEARIQGYHPYWLCNPGGYAGVAIYSKKMPINVEYGIGDEEQDADGRIMTAEYEKFYLVNVYVPNAGRKLVNLSKRMRWDGIFHDFVTKLNKKKPVIICGDMNVAHQEIDLANPKTNKKNAGFTQEERDGMTKLLSLGFIDSFRHLYPDVEKAYTFWTYMMNARSKNVGWRLDYFIVAQKLASKIVDNTIRSNVMGSDHCPITLFLDI